MTWGGDWGLPANDPGRGLRAKRSRGGTLARPRNRWRHGRRDAARNAGGAFGTGRGRAISLPRDEKTQFFLGGAGDAMKKRRFMVAANAGGRGGRQRLRCRGGGDCAGALADPGRDGRGELPRLAGGGWTGRTARRWRRSRWTNTAAGGWAGGDRWPKGDLVSKTAGTVSASRFWRAGARSVAGDFEDLAGAFDQVCRRGRRSGWFFLQFPGRRAPETGPLGGGGGGRRGHSAAGAFVYAAAVFRPFRSATQRVSCA